MQLNIIFDHNAKVEMSNDHLEQWLKLLPPQPLSYVMIRHKGQLVRENISNSLYAVIVDDFLEDVWIDKLHYTEETSQTIDWESQAKALKLSPLKTKRFVSKWVSNMIASGKNMVKWELWYQGARPFCDADNEDRNHN